MTRQERKDLGICRSVSIPDAHGGDIIVSEARGRTSVYVRITDINAGDAVVELPYKSWMALLDLKYSSEIDCEPEQSNPVLLNEGDFDN